MRGIPQETLNMAMRFLASVPYDDVPKNMPDDDGQTLSAVLVYSELKRRGLASFEPDGDSILWSITSQGILKLQALDGIPTLAQMEDN